MATVVQKSAFKPGKYRGKALAADLLRQFAEGTNKAIAAGVPIPALEKHATLAADDKETERIAATAGAGWLKKVIVEEDGSIGWELDVPEKIEQGIKDGTIKFTSPEFRPHYSAADGRYSGPLIRHVAFTPLPKAHDQGALALAMSEDAYQFGEDDYEGPADKDKNDPPADPPKESAPADPPKNPDSPPKATDKSKIEALRECFSVLGVELTSDWTPEKDGAIDELLAAMKTLAKAQAEAESKPEEPEQPEVKESQAMPFSEDEIAALPPALQAKARKANDAAKLAHEQALQFAEERERTQRETLTHKAKAANIAPGAKAALLNHLGTVQFSESGEEPSLTVETAIELLEKATPPGMQFGEADVKEVTHPDGETFFTGDGEPTPEQAEEIARRIHSRDKSKK
jgi:hypothetical protein